MAVILSQCDGKLVRVIANTIQHNYTIGGIYVGSLSATKTRLHLKPFPNGEEGSTHVAPDDLEFVRHDELDAIFAKFKVAAEGKVKLTLDELLIKEKVMEKAFVFIKETPRIGELFVGDLVRIVSNYSSHDISVGEVFQIESILDANIKLKDVKPDVTTHDIEYVSSKCLKAYVTRLEALTEISIPSQKAGITPKIRKFLKENIDD